MPSYGNNSSIVPGGNTVNPWAPTPVAAPVLKPANVPLVSNGTVWTPPPPTTSTIQVSPTTGGVSGYVPPPTVAPAPSTSLNPNANWYGQFPQSNLPTSTTPVTNSFSVDTNAPVTSNVLTGDPKTTSDVIASQKSYMDYVNQLAQANQYSPEYIAAVQGAQGIQTRDAQLQENLTSGKGFDGATSDYASSVTNRARSQNAIEGLQYTQAEQVQALIRSGNIAAASALVQAAQPQSVSPGSSLVSPMTGQTIYGGGQAYADYQAQQTYFNLAQTYPDAQIPTWNAGATAQQNLQVAQALAAQSPSFQARQTISVPLPGGGYALVNKNQIAQNSSGSTVLISPTQSAMVTAASDNIKTLSDQKAQVSTAITAADQTYPYLMAIVKQAGINDFNSPLLNQIQAAVNKHLIGPGDQQKFNIFLQSLQTEYTGILSRKGGVTNMTRAEGDNLISGSIGFAAMQKAYEAIQTDAKIILNSYDSEIAKQKTSIQGIYDQGQSLGSYTGTTSGTTSADDPMGLFTK